VEHMATTTRDLHDERAIAFFGTWMVIGLHLDGWAHNVRKPETFFSPWHFILYSGFGAAVAYFSFRGYFLKKRSTPDALTTFGLVLFIVGAVGDGIWHEIFGIEVNLEALLSPTHLALMIGGLCMLGIAYRSAWRADPPEDRVHMSLVVTMTLNAAVIMFFTQYYSAFRFGGLFAGPRNDDIWQVYALGSVFVTNAILLGLVYLIVRRWQTPRWAFTFSFAALAAATVLLDGRRGPMLNIAAAALAGLATDVLVRRLRPHAGEVRSSRLFSLLVPLAIWSLWFASLQLQDGVHWPAELWTGTIILAVLEGIGLGLLAFPGHAHAGGPAPVSAVPTQDDAFRRG
jgi:hypothetical protein